MLNRNKKINNDSFGKVKDDSHHFHYIEKYFRNKMKQASTFVLSDQTCSDLDFEELFMFIDRTNSKIGQQFLYHTLRTFTENKNIEAEEKIIDEIYQKKVFKDSLQTELSKLNKYEAYYIYSLFQEKQLEAPKWFFLIKLLPFVTLVCILLSFLYPSLVLILLAIIIINIGFHYWNKKNLFIYSESIPQLIKMTNVARNLYRIDSLRLIFPKVGNSIQALENIKKRAFFFSVEEKLQSDFSSILWSVFELIKMCFLLEAILLFNVLKKIETKKDEIEEVFAFLGKTDSLYSIASLRYGLQKWSVPNIHNNPKFIDAVNLYHPLINNCVPNSIRLDGKSVLLTGSNMSGKTSFIRIIGINTITALSINTVFGEKFSLPFVNLITAIRISDDLLNDKSYYFEEVLRIKEMISESEKETNNLFLLDEIFKGTNTVERIAAGKSVLSYLSVKNLVFVSTHDIELADLLKNEYNLYHFSETISDKSIDFDYILKEGKLTRRNAIKILEINGYPAPVIAEAMKIAQTMNLKP